jgi:hypothetical protein
MSTSNPDDLFAQLEDVFSGVLDEDVENVTMMSSSDLLKKYFETTETLKELGQALNPKTQFARDLHSKRYSYKLELNKRGLM